MADKASPVFTKTLFDMSKRTAVLGASPNPQRYSHIATHMLLRHGFEVRLFGNKKGQVAGIEIEDQLNSEDAIHTLTLYMNPQRQVPLYQDILNLKPQRIIFNPGTENAELKRMAENAGIETVEACTLVMLSTAQY